MAKVKYRVVGRCFVNGSYRAPHPGRELIIEAEAGLEGSALQLVKDEPPVPHQIAEAGDPPADPVSDPTATGRPAPSVGKRK